MSRRNALRTRSLVTLLAVMEAVPALAGIDLPSTQPYPGNVPSTQPASVTATQVTVSDNDKVEMHVNDANLLEVLRLLSLQAHRNIIASKDVAGTVTANLYNVTLLEALDAILQSNGYVYREKGNFIYVYTAKELVDLDKSTRLTATEVFHLYYTTAANAATMIKPALSSDAQVAVTTAAQAGIEITSADAGGDSRSSEDMLVVTDYTENLEKVRQIIKEVDRRPKQVLIEATILAATLSDNNAMGVDFSVMGGVRFDQFLTSPAQTIANAAAGTLTNSASNAGVGGYSIGQTSFTNNLPPGGLRVGVLTNNISVFVQALESVTNTTVLANPKVLSLDKQKGYVHVGRSDGYQTTTVSSTTSTQTVQFLDSGTTLAFRPYVGDDGYVRMEIHPEDSSGGLTSTNLPFKTTTEVTTNMMVKDGRTIVIGGLFRETSTVTRGQVPGLGSIPFLGVLFRQKQDQTQRQEIIILLTPHVLKDDSSYDRASETAMKRVEDLRVGMRKGMMFFGRERLAEIAYENAMHELDKPKPNVNLALWHLDAATNLNPTFLEAIQLKEKVSGKRVTDVDNSVVRDFISKSALSDMNAAPAAGSGKTMRRNRNLILAACLGTALYGCNSNSITPDQKAQANHEWNAARAGVLASLANDQYQSGNLDRCEETLSRALLLAKDSVPLHLLAAKLSIEQGKLEVAESHLKEATRLDPKNAEADYLTGVILQRWQQPERARAAYASAAAKDPTELSYLLAEAEMLVVLDQPEPALDLLRAKADFFEHSGVIRDEIGMLMLEQDETDQGIAELREACLLSAEDVSIREHLATALYRNHQYRDAETALGRLLKEPGFEQRSDLLCALGDCQSQTDERLAALHSYDAATKIDPTSCRGWIGLARVQLQSDNLSAAELAARRATSIDATSGDAQCLLGYVRLKQNDLSLSLLAFNAAATLDPADATSVSMAGIVLNRMGRPSEARRRFEKALQISPHDPLSLRLAADLPPFPS